MRRDSNSRLLTENQESLSGLLRSPCRTRFAGLESDANSNYKDTTVNRITNGVMYMGCGTAWRGRLPCKQEIQASSILARSSKKYRVVAQFGRALHSGCRGCRFKSGQSDDVL